MIYRGTVCAVCVSEEKGTSKHPVPEVALREAYGIEGDAHAGNWHRQVSFLAAEKVQAFNARGGSVEDGGFGENILTEGIDWSSLPVGSRITAGGAVLELTQIGKACHSRCHIYETAGDCIMPREGVFARVLTGGSVKAGDPVAVELPAAERPFTAAVITMSDKGAAGERTDESGPAAAAMLEAAGYRVVETMILPDDPGRLKAALMELADRRQVELILTSGGTGFSLRDTTPEATMAVADRNAPGIAEAIRAESAKYTNRAMLSRGVSVLRGQSLIVNLPGSPKAVRESLSAVLEPIGHGLGILRGTEGECARH